MNNIINIIGEKYKSISFTMKMYKLRPDLFNSNVQSLLYFHYAGTSYKPDMIYSMFEQYMLKHDDEDILITWARSMKDTKTSLVFEPVMNDLSKVMNVWMNNRKVLYNKVMYDVEIFKPLLYNNNAECFIDLLPYICYLVTFFVHCRPFSFNEAQTESSTHGFYKALDAYYMLNYNNFNEDFSQSLNQRFDIMTLSDRDLLSINLDQLKKMYSVMLHPDKIISIRNKEMSKTENMLDECISDQNALSYNFINNAWNNTISELLNIVINNTPIKRVFDLIPRFNTSVNTHELMMWTQYCLAGGDKKFIIKNNNVQLISDQESVVPYPSDVFGKQEIVSKINRLNISYGLPFCRNDLILELGTSYLQKKYNNIITDALVNNPFTIDEQMLKDYKGLNIILLNLFCQGEWMHANSIISDLLNLMLKLKHFDSELHDILLLFNVTSLVYDNKLASVVISSLILSYFDKWMLLHCLNKRDLNNFSLYKYIINTEEYEFTKINYICDIVNSLIMINNKTYSSFVNDTMKRFTDMIILKPYIYQLYVKSLNDSAELYAIGGCELYDYAKNPNPLIRCKEWYTQVFGTTESIEIFFAWIEKIENTSTLELIEENKDNINVIDSLLKTLYNKLTTTNKEPLLLSNYMFNMENLSYRKKYHPYFLDLTIKEENILTVLSKYIFNKSFASQSTEKKILFKPLIVNNDYTISVDKGVEGSFNSVGSNVMVPIYNYISAFDEVKIIITPPPGYRSEVYELFTSKNKQNQTILLYTNMKIETRYS